MAVKRSPVGEYYIVMVLDKPLLSIGKTHDGASVGIDFWLKRNMTMSDGMAEKNPLVSSLVVVGELCYPKRSLIVGKRRRRLFSLLMPWC